MTQNQQLWSIYVNGKVLDHPSMYEAGYVAYGTKIDMEINTHGSMEFTVPMENPNYQVSQKIGSIVIALNGDTEVFRGRIAETKRDFYNNIKVYCEGQLAFLCDSRMPPFSVKESVKTFLSRILTMHNECVDENRQFQLGTVTVTDPDNNGILVRSSESSLSAWEIISERLVNSLGGYLRVRKAAGKYYLDYLSELTEKSGQSVSFGNNLLNLEEHITGDEIATVVYPFGAKIEEDGTNENSYDKYQNESTLSSGTLWHGNRVTVREVNSGVMYVEDETGIGKWGKIWGTNVWDDVTLPENLMKRAKAWLKERETSTTAITLNAVDLHLVDADIDAISMGQLVLVKSEPHGINEYLPCVKTHTEPGNPDSNTIGLGVTRKTLTRKVAQNAGR